MAKPGERAPVVPPDLLPLLPAGVRADEVTHLVRLSMALDNEFGETLLVVQGGELKVLVRPLLARGFVLQALAPGSAPALRRDGITCVLELDGADGVRHRIEPSSFDLAAVEQAVAAAGVAAVAVAGVAAVAVAGVAAAGAEEAGHVWPRESGHAARRLPDAHWTELLRHPAEDPHLGAILGVVAPVVGGMTARPAKHYGLGPKQRRELRTCILPVAKALARALEVLEGGEVHLFIVGEREHGLLFAHTDDGPALVAGLGVLAERPEAQLAFIAGWHVALLRPERLIGRMLPSAEQVRIVLSAAMRLVEPGFPVPDTDVGDVEKIGKAIAASLSRGALEELRRCVREAIEERSELDVEAWWHACALTADRAGLLLCGDLEAAGAALRGVPSISELLTEEERRAELERFARSEERSELRRRFGLG